MLSCVFILTLFWRLKAKGALFWGGGAQSTSMLVLLRFEPKNKSDGFING